MQRKLENNNSTLNKVEGKEPSEGKEEEVSTHNELKHTKTPNNCVGNMKNQLKGTASEDKKLGKDQ